MLAQGQSPPKKIYEPYKKILQLSRLICLVHLLGHYLLGLLLLGLGPPAAARALPPHLLQVVAQVPLDILPDSGLRGDFLAPRIRVNTEEASFVFTLSIQVRVQSPPSPPHR